MWTIVEACVYHGEEKRLGGYMMAIARVKYVKVLFFFFPRERNMIKGGALRSIKPELYWQ